MQMRNGAMYLPAVQKVPYFNRNETFLKWFCAIESLYDCYPSIYLSIDTATPSSGFPRALEHMENYKKIPCMEISWNLKND